jgi:hypothetical protein
VALGVTGGIGVSPPLGFPELQEKSMAQPMTKTRNRFKQLIDRVGNCIN